MKTSDFNFELPDHLIAQRPCQERGQSRLMILDRKTGTRQHAMVSDLPNHLEEGTVLVFNNSKVRKARLFGLCEKTGAKNEFLLLNKIDDHSWQVISKHSKRKKPGDIYVFKDNIKAILVQSESTDNSGLVLCFETPINDEWLERYGHIPLPPYIKREDTADDSNRYQTVYAKQTGSSAAPTAGLHFTNELLAQLDSAGMESVFITLHVGLGTFLPVRTQNIEEHNMHEESFTINTEAAEIIEKARKENRKILAIGTTSLRTLESAWQQEHGRLQRGQASTSIFIYPGYNFKITDMLFTNFHTPMSTLLMLVSAFAGKDFIMEAYKEAIKKEYSFFSYGDAMLIM